MSEHDYIDYRMDRITKNMKLKYGLENLINPLIKKSCSDNIMGWMQLLMSEHDYIDYRMDRITKNIKLKYGLENLINPLIKNSCSDNKLGYEIKL